MGLQHLYYANSLRNLIMKICAYLPQIPNFGFDVRSVPMILEYSNFYPSVFTPIHIFFKVLQNFLRKKLFSIHPTVYSLFSKLFLITFYSPSFLGQETAKESFGLRVKLPPAHLSTTHGGALTLLLLNVKQESCEY